MPALLAATPTFERVTALVDSVDLPNDLAIYIIWLVGDTGRVLDDLSESFRPFAGLVDHGGGGTNFASTRIPADWSVVLDRLQVLLCLLQAEAGRRRMGPLAELGFDVSWTRPRVKPDGIRLGNRVADQVYFAAPTFPRGSAYARCDVGPREQEAARIAAAERASLVAGPSGQSP
jgi:hypothetical protein